MNRIKYSSSHITDAAKKYIYDCLDNQYFESGPYTEKCINELRKTTGASSIYLTPSCTDALEMTALLLDIQSGDEVIMPSFTFVSTANAFVLRGATAVFVDIDEETLNIDVSLIEKAITDKTKAIVVVHYAGVACDIDKLLAISKQYHVPVVEDAAQCIKSYYKNQHLGTFGALSTISFHHTKNITAGLGGALIINDDKYIKRAATLHTKGTNRDEYLSGIVDKYTWVDVGSSFMMSELNAALLYSQLGSLVEITSKRLAIYQQYFQAFLSLTKIGIRVPFAPAESKHNAHIFYLIMPDELSRNDLLTYLRNKSIESSFHYIPLHSSPAGMKYGRVNPELAVTNKIASRIIRLPLHCDMSIDDVEYVIYSVREFCRQ